MKKLFLLLFLSGCSFAPSYDSNINAKMAEIKTNAIDLKLNCPLASQKIHEMLVIPSMNLEYMSTYRNDLITKLGHDVWKETNSFEVFVQSQEFQKKTTSAKYCSGKLDNIILTMNSIMKTYGETK